MLTMIRSTWVENKMNGEGFEHKFLHENQWSEKMIHCRQATVASTVPHLTFQITVKLKDLYL